MELMEIRPPHIRFLNEEVEDREKSIELGYFVPKNEHYVELSQVGSRDSVKKKVDDWLRETYEKGMTGFIPNTWHGMFSVAYEEWKKGNEIPEFGTPILTYLPFSPLQRKQLTSAGIRTLEDCAAMSEEAMRKVGAGARELKEKAKAALSSANTLLAENEVLKTENDALKERIATLEKQISEKMKKSA